MQNIRLQKLFYQHQLPNSVCDWKPSIIIFRGSLPQGIVQVQFTQAPQLLNISMYEVTFIPLSSVKQKKVFGITADQEKNLLLVEFMSNVNGHCTLKVAPLTHDGSECLGAEIVFYVGSWKSVLVEMIILYVCIILFSLGTFVFLKYIFCYICLFDSAFKPYNETEGNVSESINSCDIGYSQESIYDKYDSDSSSFQSPEAQENSSLIRSLAYGSSAALEDVQVHPPTDTHAENVDSNSYEVLNFIEKRKYSDMEYEILMNQMANPSTYGENEFDEENVLSVLFN